MHIVRSVEFSTMANALLGLIACGIVGLVLSKTPNDSYDGSLFWNLAKKNPEANFVTAPEFLRSSLALIYAGSYGLTRGEIKNYLKLPSGPPGAVLDHISKPFERSMANMNLAVATKIFLDSSYTVNPRFVEFIKKLYNSEAGTVNFNQTEEAISTINSWIHERSGGKISDFIPSGSLNASTKALVANGVYFKGNWRSAFQRNATEKRPFWVSATKSIEVDVMHQKNSFDYAELPEWDATAVFIPYNNTDLSLLVVLPNKRDGLVDLDNKVSFRDIPNLAGRFKTQLVDLYLPKFSGSMKFGVDLKVIIKEWGVKTMFGNMADFSGIFESGPPLKFDGVRQKVVIEVDEDGADPVPPTTPLGEAEQIFLADHPFIFSVLSHNEVFFIGHVVDFS